ncbi:ankyrin repeat-containing domain protein [Absidia repens]|uniref:Ankyrin repeat-containing domain protein n=1 Tax=Absidia repens TaxID=90262 RepID=A0A1X2ID73_9FUNG|nr:ankyrin repeat-containing domain protein [Absidia repens]
MDFITSLNSNAEIPQMELWFESAFDYLNTHTVTVSKDNKLKFYGYFKQATTGDCTIAKPNLFEFVARAKWDAWNNLKGMESPVAMEAYVELAESLDIGWTRQGEYQYEAKDSNKDTEETGHVLSSLAHADDDDEDNKHDLIGYTKANKLDQVREQVKEQKEPVNTKDEEGLTALHHACDRGYTDIVQLLLDLGADINATTNDSETPLHYACISEQAAAAQLLIDKGCNLTIKDADDQTAFDLVDSTFLSLLNYTS